jgi:hypothetical protein
MLFVHLYPFNSSCHCLLCILFSYYDNIIRLSLYTALFHTLFDWSSPLVWKKNTHHQPVLVCCRMACVSVSMRVLCNNFSVLFCFCLSTDMLFVHVYTFPRLLVYPLLIQLYGFVSLCTQLLLILQGFIYWSSPLLFNKLLISSRERRKKGEREKRRERGRKESVMANMTVTMTMLAFAPSLRYHEKSHRHIQTLLNQVYLRGWWKPRRCFLLVFASTFRPFHHTFR